MAAAVVNKFCHVCYPKLGRSFTLRNTKTSEFVLSVAGVRKRNITKVSYLYNHDVSFQKNNIILNTRRACDAYSKILKRLSTNPTPKHGAEKELTDVRNHVQELLSKDTSLSFNQKDVYMKIADNVMRRSSADLSYDDLEITEDQVSPSELYSLGSKIFSLQNKVGEEASVIAFPLFKFAASLGYKDAKYTYGQLLIRGPTGVLPNPAEAAILFTDLAKEGHAYAQFALAGMYYTGYGIEQSYEKCYTLYQIASENGIKQSYNCIGKLYLNGQGVATDEKKAIEYFMKGAEAGDPQGYMSLGHCYSHGKGVEVDFKKSFNFHLQAAHIGYPPAIYNVGTHYFMGKGVDADASKAAEYFHKSSDLGFSLADMNLGNMYYQGHGVEQDWQKAKEHYRRASLKHKNAEMLLEGVEKEEKKLEEEKAKTIT